MLNEFITVGQVVRAVGIRGEIKVRPITDDPSRFSVLKVVYAGSKPYRIERYRSDGDFVYLKLGGVDDRNAAEALRDAFLSIDRVNAVPLDGNTFFIADILGCKLLTSDGEEKGKITDISNYGAADVFTATDGVRTVRFPFLKKMIVKVAPASGVVIVDKDVFDEVSVYEDED